jgi:hypothetical protein
MSNRFTEQLLYCEQEYMAVADLTDIILSGPIFGNNQRTNFFCYFYDSFTRNEEKAFYDNQLPLIFLFLAEMSDSELDEFLETFL